MTIFTKKVKTITKEELTDIKDEILNLQVASNKYISKPKLNNYEFTQLIKIGKRLKVLKNKLLNSKVVCDD